MHLYSIKYYLYSTELNIKYVYHMKNNGIFNLKKGLLSGLLFVLFVAYNNINAQTSITADNQPLQSNKVETQQFIYKFRDPNCETCRFMIALTKDDRTNIENKIRVYEGAMNITDRAGKVYIINPNNEYEVVSFELVPQ